MRAFLIFSFALLSITTSTVCKAQTRSKNINELKFDSLQFIIKSNLELFNSFALPATSSTADDYAKDLSSLTYAEIIDKYKLGKKDQKTMLELMEVSTDIILRDKKIQELLNLSSNRIDSLLNTIDTSTHQFNAGPKQDSTSLKGWTEIGSPR